MSSESEKSPVAKRILSALCILMVLMCLYVGGYYSVVEENDDWPHGMRWGISSPQKLWFANQGFTYKSFGLGEDFSKSFFYPINALNLKLFYQKNANLKEFNFKGNVMLYYPAGTGIKYAGQYLAGFTERSGISCEGRIIDRYAEGMWTFTKKSSGLLIGEMRFIKGSPDGKFVFWHPNGKTRWTGRFRYNEHSISIREGEFKLWDENGSLLLENEYHDQQNVVMRREWDKQGKLVDEFYYIDPVSVNEKEWEAYIEWRKNRNGEFTLWYEKGKKYLNISVVGVKRYEKREHWDSDGRLDKVRYYFRGNEVARAFWVRRIDGTLYNETYSIHGKQVTKSEWKAYEAEQKSKSPK